MDTTADSNHTSPLIGNPAPGTQPIFVDPDTAADYSASPHDILMVGQGKGLSPALLDDIHELARQRWEVRVAEPVEPEPPTVVIINELATLLDAAMAKPTEAERNATVASLVKMRAAVELPTDEFHEIITTRRVRRHESNDHADVIATTAAFLRAHIEDALRCGRVTPGPRLIVGTQRLVKDAPTGRGYIGRPSVPTFKAR